MSSNLATASPEMDSYKLAIGFGAANAIFSTVAYFLVENKKGKSPHASHKQDEGAPRDLEDQSTESISEKHHETSGDYEATTLQRIHMASPVDAKEICQQGSDEQNADNNGQLPTKPSETGPGKNSASGSIGLQGLSLRISRGLPEEPHGVTHRATGDSSEISSLSAPCSSDTPYETNEIHRFRGRRFLLLTSLLAGTFLLILTGAMFLLPIENAARTPMIVFFIMLFTANYSPGAGCIPFLYTSEIFPNEGRGPQPLQSISSPWLTQL